MPLGKAVGPDLVNNRILKELAPFISKPLSKLFSVSIATSTFPSSWKVANVSPIFKKDGNTVISNFRPISLLSTISKVFERSVYKYLLNHLLDYKILTPFQSGFLPGDSTINQLTYLYHSFCHALDSGKEVRVVFCDISKAFDRVWHKGILIKLKSIGITGHILGWFEDYLTNRKQALVLNGSKSDYKFIHAGVPQGSILGPILFLIYINDIVTDIQANIRLFADDTSPYVIVENPIEAANTINSDLEKINNWAKKWLFSFNPNKTKTSIVSKKINKPPHPPILMNNHIIEDITEHKHLGIFLSNDCSWGTHINYIKKKAWARLHLLQKFKFVLDRKSLETLYLSFIRPLLEYGSLVFDNCTTHEKSELDKINIEAARVVTGTTKLVPINKLLNEIGWQTLEERRTMQKLTMLYRIQNDLTPTYLKDALPVRDTLRYNFRSVDDIPTLPCRTNLYYNSFFPFSIRAWNTLPSEIQHAPSLNHFKKSLQNHYSLLPVPEYFHLGPRKLQIYHTRLRTQCSTLNDHLYKKILSPRLFVYVEKENQLIIFFLNVHNTSDREINFTLQSLLWVKQLSLMKQFYCQGIQVSQSMTTNNFLP